MSDTGQRATGAAADDTGIDFDDLADRLLGQYIITYDTDGEVNAIHAARTADARSELVEFLRDGPWRQPDLLRQLDRLRVHPDDPVAYRAAVATLATELRAGAVPAATFLQTLGNAEERGATRYRLGVLVGARSAPASVQADIGTLADLAAPPVSRERTWAELAVVMSVRFAHETDNRLRNCLASVQALNRQVGDRTRFRLVVVEQGERPLGERLLEPLVDDYVFVANPGPFNKSWGLNVGVLTASGSRYLCMIDADSLVPPDFITGVLDRMRGGTQAELPFTELLFLDQASTVRAISQRLFAPDGVLADLDPRTMRGFALLGVKGFCICVTREVFDRADGYDERYLVWGDEDNEFYSRVAEQVAIARQSASMLHLWHERPTMLVAGNLRPNSHLIGVPRPIDREPIGRRDKYVDQQMPTSRP